VATGNDVTLAVWYYKQVNDKEWVRVHAKELHVTGTNQVILQQPSADLVTQFTNLRTVDLDLTVQLFVVVARNLGAPDTSQHSYSAVGGAVTVDTLPGTRRGLILVFTKKAVVTANTLEAADVGQLMSTTEPEIKNGIGGG
jgi:hypothetical protein